MLTPAMLADLPPWDWPKESHQMLREVLGDDGATEADRLLAAELAGEEVVLDDELASALLALLGDAKASEELRGQAAISLGPALELADMHGFDEDDSDDLVPITEASFARIKRGLREVFDDQALPDLVRRRALEASVRAPEPWHAEAVREAYASEDPAWRLTAVFAMRWVGGFEAQILESLDSDDPAIALEAIHAAGAQEVDAAWPQIKRVLAGDPSPSDRLFAAIEAVVTVRPAEASEVLGPLLDADDEDVVDAAHEAIAMAQGLAEMEEMDEEADDDRWLQ